MTRQSGRKNDRGLTTADIVVSVATVCLLSSAVAVYYDILPADKIRAIAPIIVAAITLTYAYLTYKLVLETRRGRRAQVEPNLQLEADRYGPKIVNRGRGPAINIQGKIGYDNYEEPTKEVTINSLTPDEEHLITDEIFSSIVSRDSDIHESYERLSISFYWEDLLENTDSLNQTVKTEELISESSARTEPIESIEQRLTDLVTQVEKLRMSIESQAGDDSD